MASSFSILRQRNFGLVWLAVLLGGMGAQMETMVVAWFVLTLTDSPFLVGLAGSARMGANVLALFAGAIADRLPRHLLLAASGFVTSSFALIILILLLTGLLEVWHLFALTFASGLARIFQLPAGQSLAADSVTQDRVSNSIALVNTGMNINFVIAPLIGGILFEEFGPEGAYALMAVLYFLGGVTSLFIRVSRTSASQARESVWRLIAGGLKYVKVRQVLWAGLLVGVIINFSGFPFHTILIPIFAQNELGTDARGLGILMSAFGIGSLAGSLGVASVQNLNHIGKLLIFSVLAWYFSMVVFSIFSASFAVSMATLMLTGMAFSSSLVLSLTILLRTALPEYRGRIMGLRAMAIYPQAFGSLISGAMAGAWGTLVAVNVNAAIGIVLISILAFLTPKFRRS